MPIYEYRCNKCGRFEQFQRITEDPLTTCPKCGGPIKRLISSNVNIIFKGSGYYTTDNRSKEYTEKAKQDAGESQESATSSKAANA